MKIIKWLSIFLSISLGANFWFLWYFYEQEKVPSGTENNALQNNAPVQFESKNKNAIKDFDSESTANVNNNKKPHNNKGFSDSIPAEVDLVYIKNQRSSFLQYLKELEREQKYVLLDYEVSDYLRMYPQDIEALLLEAKAYYHTQPLNTALVHYIELLSLPLSADDRQEVEKIIAVNITRIIQQFSGESAWDLLAEFLEPLVQVDPINRQYLMPLARAYGMQQQFTLMEDVLAAFPPTDLRANKLRENVLARLNNENTVEPPNDIPLLEEVPFRSNRVADVLLKQTRGHFVTQAQVHNTLVNLLVDTGASTTAISDIKFSTIPKEQVEFLGLFNVNTAGGAIEAPIYKVQQFKLGRRVLRNTSVLVLPGQNLNQYDGLLGMNVLSQFDLAYDASSETMRLYKKR